MFIIRFIVILVLIAIAAPPAALAWNVLQQKPEMVEPTPLDPEEPRARQAAALVTRILAGDRAAVLQTLRAEGTPALASNPELEGIVDAQLARIANKGFTIAEFMTGRGADVLVALLDKNAQPDNIVIRFTPTAPHRIEGFAHARMQ